MLPLKYLSNLRYSNTFEISIINEINLILTWPNRCVLSNSGAQVTTFTLTDTKRRVPAVNLLTEDNAKLLLQLKLGFKSTINRNKYL